MTIPPFCPNPACVCSGDSAHRPILWYRKRGFYHTKNSGTVQRFVCCRCGTTFSTRTFSLDFMTHKHLPYQRILTHLVTSSGIRDIARDLHVAPATILNRISRLARQAIAVHAELVSSLPAAENLVADGFESFAVSQYFPNNFTLLAGKESQFWYATEYAHLRRKGQMTDAQKRKNILLQSRFISGRISIYSSFLRVLDRIDSLSCPDSSSPVELFTDEHIQYSRAIDRARPFLRRPLVHHTVPSTLPRTVTNQLFSVNYLDREIRKDCAEHVRETVKFARNVCNSLERLAIYRLYHNYMKPFRIGERDFIYVSHGMKAGMDAKQIARCLMGLYSRRRFLSRAKGLPFSEALVWLRGVATPLKASSEYLPSYAWQ